MDLKNKTILITGGTGSFGKAFSKELLRKHTNLKKLLFLVGMNSSSLR